MLTLKITEEDGTVVVENESPCILCSTTPTPEHDGVAFAAARDATVDDIAFALANGIRVIDEACSKDKDVMYSANAMLLTNPSLWGMVRGWVLGTPETQIKRKRGHNRGFAPKVSRRMFLDAVWDATKDEDIAKFLDEHPDVYEQFVNFSYAIMKCLDIPTKEKEKKEISHE